MGSWLHRLRCACERLRSDGLSCGGSIVRRRRLRRYFKGGAVSHRDMAGALFESSVKPVSCGTVFEYRVLDRKSVV